MTVTLSFDLTLLYVVAINVLVILVYVLLLRQRARRQAHNVTAVSKAVADYFRADGIEVYVECVARPGGKGFIALIESVPMKRFRYSYVVEASLRTHVSHVCGQELERIFWRFPIPGKGQAAEAAIGEMEIPDDEHDEYVREGLKYLKKEEGYDIREGSWEEFENTVTNRDAGQGQNPKE
jgi:hypothetical protein